MAGAKPVLPWFDDGPKISSWDSRWESQLKTKPYEHQLKVLSETWSAPYWGLLMDMGTGKSKVLIDTAAMLYWQGCIRGLLVVAPKGVYNNWVAKELPAHLPDAIDRTVYLWTPADTQKAQEAKRKLLAAPGLAVLAMNVEALSTAKGVAFAETFLKSRPCMMAVDESTTIKSPSASRTKAAIRLGRLAAYTRILTGSPITKSPLDAYSQCQFLQPGALGSSSYYAFRARYSQMVDQRMGSRSFKKIVGYRNLDELTRKLDGFTSRVLKGDCLDLPPKVYVSRDVELTDEQRTAYEQMKRDAVATIEGSSSVATVVITQLLRLHQIACGHLTTEAGIVPLPNKRIDALLETLAETQGKAIVWATYRHDLAEIERALRAEYGERSVVSYHGGTSPADRAEAIVRFQGESEHSARWFVGQEATGGYGLTLTAADLVVYYSNSYSLEQRLQSEDRAHRIGQTNKVTYVDLVARGTVDEKIIRSLREKMDVASQVLGDGWREWLI